VGFWAEQVRRDGGGRKVGWAKGLREESFSFLFLTQKTFE
jgi:hypothetical protein